MTGGQDTWSARCVETRTAGAAGGPGKPTGSNPGRAPRSDPTSPDPVPLATLVKVAGRRWTIEENFQASKGLTGLDEHQVRRWASWYRWVTLAMLAAAVLTIAAAFESLRTPDPAGQIPLTRNEIAHLFADLTIKHPHDDRHRIRWSPGDDATSTAPRTATTSGKQPKTHEHNDLRLEY
jgi:hypothetical protein